MYYDLKLKSFVWPGTCSSGRVKGAAWCQQTALLVYQTWKILTLKKKKRKKPNSQNDKWQHNLWWDETKSTFLSRFADCSCTWDQIHFIYIAVKHNGHLKALYSVRLRHLEMQLCKHSQTMQRYFNLKINLVHMSRIVKIILKYPKCSSNNIRQTLYLFQNPRKYLVTAASLREKYK